MNTTLGKRIAALRHEKGLKQDELAEQLGVTPQAVSKWENDQTCPDITLLPLLASILGVSVDELLSGKQEDPSVVRLLPENERKDIKDMMLRIVVTSAGNDKVRVNIPLTLVEVALESGLDMAQISGNANLGSIDLKKIFEMVKQGAIGNLVEVESSAGDTVKIFVE
ncbi:MAG: helix-turn-helix transcriptional regulator [Clostridia bacterium]|nr:helix-turn-helix transcriptional regulator [Clostridia bacterium]